MTTKYGILINHETQEPLGPANLQQLSHSLNAKPLGIILVDGVRCRVIQPPAGSDGLLQACSDYGDHESDYGSGVDA
jgi:hypothetical protein